MYVDASNVAFYLAERQLLTLRSVVEGDFLVVDQSSRNRNLKVIRKRSPGYFIKQVRSSTPDTARTLQREAACYQLADRQPRLSGLASLLPRCHHYDPVRVILVLEMLPHAESLWEHHQRVGGFPLDLAVLQGQKLGSFQARTDLAGLGAEELKPFERRIPWILSIHETNPMYLSQMSLGNSQLLGILQQHPEFPAALEEIKRGWKHEVIIHGDIKWENLVLCRQREDAPPDLRVIDWEMADVGDACWDAGAVFQAYLSFWIFSLPLTPGVSLEQAVAASPFAVGEMQAALAAYWASYAAARALMPAASEALLVRSMQCAAARMIQTAYEGIQMSPQITPQALCQLQMSMNVLSDPAAAVREFLGRDGADRPPAPAAAPVPVAIPGQAGAPAPAAAPGQVAAPEGPP
jgi:hypothetical protein